MFKEGLLKGKRILVTGGGTGLGKEIATKYLSLGADIWDESGPLTGLHREDAWVNLVEVAKENWSFGNGVASYAPAETVAA